MELLSFNVCLKPYYYYYYYYYYYHCALAHFVLKRSYNVVFFNSERQCF